MPVKDYKCRCCGCKNFFFRNKGFHVGIYCIDCGTWLKWANKPERDQADRILEEVKW